MGGLGPGIGGFEIVVIGLVALLVVGPKDLPVLMRRVGQMVSKARAMAKSLELLRPVQHNTSSNKSL